MLQSLCANSTDQRPPSHPTSRAADGGSARAAAAAIADASMALIWAPHRVVLATRSHMKTLLATVLSFTVMLLSVASLPAVVRADWVPADG